jgi:hypothetical protein
MSEEIRGDSCTTECQECKARMEQMKKQEEIHFAVLVALVPVMVFTFINTVGLF